jgi:hypothetical protein
MNRADPLQDPIATEPHLVGPHARAWHVDLDATRRKLKQTADQDGTVRIWIAEAPWAHPCWHSYAIVLLHLRPLPGKKTLIYLEGATHEIWVQALHPDYAREPAIRGEQPWAFMTPNNYSSQFIADSDGAAAARVEEVVQRICDGTLSPDTDFIRVWQALFGDNMFKKAVLA